MRPHIALAFCALATPGLAETVTVPCPIGGAPIEIEQTFLCERGGWTMSLRQITDCDDKRLMPVCPDSGLPVYGKYSDSEAEALAEFNTTPLYSAGRGKSDWLRAADVADFLEGWESEDGFALALNLLWFEHEALLADAGLLDRFQRAALAEADRRDDGGGAQAFARGIAAYVLILSGQGQEDTARGLLDLAQAAAASTDLQSAWLAQVRACLGHAALSDCRPETRFSP